MFSRARRFAFPAEGNVRYRPCVRHRVRTQCWTFAFNGLPIYRLRGVSPHVTLLCLRDVMQGAYRGPRHGQISQLIASIARIPNQCRPRT